MMLEIGLKGKQEMTVSKEHTAKAMGSGQLPVLATPALIALAEKTAWMSVADALEEGQGTVGTRLDIAHTAATALHRKVWCETRLTEIDRRRLVFAVTVCDEAGQVAAGTHERFIIDNESFLKKVDNRS